MSTNAALELTPFLVDRIGELRAKIAALQEQAAAVEDNLKLYGTGEYEGVKFRATVKDSERTTVAWKAIAEKLEASRQLVTAHSTTKACTTLRVTARKRK